MGDSRFPRRARLAGQRAFEAVFQHGERRHGALFRLHLLPVAPGAGALGIAVPKRAAARASERNRIRRIVREAYRVRRSALGHWQLVLLARAAASGATAAALREDAERLFELAAALKPSHRDGTIAR